MTDPIHQHEPFPDDMVIAPLSRRPLRLPPETVARVLTGKIPATAAAPHSDEDARPIASLIVVTFNNLLFTRLCLESLLLTTRDVLFELILADNASTDGTVAYLRELAGGDSRV